MLGWGAGGTVRIVVVAVVMTLLGVAVGAWIRRDLGPRVKPTYIAPVGTAAPTASAAEYFSV